MRAAFAPRYGSGDVLEFRDLPDPVPGPGTVAVRVHAATVTRTDRETLRAHPWFARLATGLLRPKKPVLGLDFAGVVTETGAGVTRFAAGDRVFGIAPGEAGAHAEVLTVPEDGSVEIIPDGLDFADAVVGEGAWYAHSNLEKAGLGPGQSILVYGASGAIGTAAVQLAKARGARVVAVVSTGHVKMAQDIGADRVIDYTGEDFTACGETFDAVFDAVGKTSYFRCRDLVAPGGVYMATDLGPWGQNVWLPLWLGLTRARARVFIGMPVDHKPVVTLLRDLLAAGRYRAVIDRHVPFEDIRAAYARVASEQKTGIVVLDMPVPGGAGGTGR